MMRIIVVSSMLACCGIAMAGNTIYWAGWQDSNWDTGTTGTNWSTSYAKAIDYGQRPQNGDTVLFTNMSPAHYSSTNVNFTGLTLGGLEVNHTGIGIIGQPFALQGDAANSSGGAATISNDITILPTGLPAPHDIPWFRGSFILNGNLTGMLHVDGTTVVNGIFADANVDGGQLQIGPHDSTLNVNSISLYGPLRIDGANVVVGTLGFQAGDRDITVNNGSLQWNDEWSSQGCYRTHGNGDFIKNSTDDIEFPAGYWAHTGWSRIWRGSVTCIGGGPTTILFAGRDFQLAGTAPLHLQRGTQYIRTAVGSEIRLSQEVILEIDGTESSNVDITIRSMDGDPSQRLIKSGSGFAYVRSLPINMSAYVYGGTLSSGWMQNVYLEGGTYQGWAQNVAGSSGSIGDGQIVTLSTATVSKVGSGTCELSTGISGLLNIQEGTLRLMQTLAGLSQVVIGPGGSLETNTINRDYYVPNLTGSGSVRVNAGRLAVTNTGSTSTDFSGNISGAGGLQSTGLTTLSGVNSYAGATRVASGTLRVTGGHAIPDLSNVTLAASSKLDVGVAETIGSLASEGSSSTSEVILNSDLVCDGNGANTTFRGVISGSRNLIKNSGATLTLAGTQPNTMSSSALLSGGTLVLAKSDSVQALGDFEASSCTLRTDSSGQFAPTAMGFLDGSMLDLAGQSATLAYVYLTESSTLSLGTGSITAEIEIYDGSQITGPGTVQGSVLALNNTALDGTAGTLVFANAVSGNAAFLGNVTFQAEVAPGNPITAMHIENATLESTAVLALGIGGTAGGVTYDQVVVSGSAALDGTLNLQMAPSGLVHGTQYTLIDGAVTGSFANVLGLPAGWRIEYGSTAVKLVEIVRFDYDGNGRVEAADRDVFFACAAGPGIPGPPAGCTSAQFTRSNWDGDADVDQVDFAAFQRCWSGSLPANPTCSD